MAPSGVAAASTMAGHWSASCWPMTASWFSARASVRGLDGRGFGHAPGSYSFPLRTTFGLGGGGLGLADGLGRLGLGGGGQADVLRFGAGRQADPLGLGARFELHPLGLGGGLQLGLLGQSLGGGDPGVALALGQRALLVGLGIGGL